MRFRKQTVLSAAALALTLFLAGCGPKGDAGKEGAKGGEKGAAKGAPAAQEATPVRVLPAKMQKVARRVPVTGSVAALKEVTLSPRVSAKVARVNGREGERVSAGQIVLQQETTDFAAQVAQGVANVQTARARLAQAQTQATLQRTTSSAGVRDAEERLRSARSALSLAKRPQRTQEVTVAENQVAQAQANYDKAKTDLERYQALLKEGAIAAATVDQYIQQERVSRANLSTAKEQLDLAREGGRTETIRQSESLVRQAEQALRLAKSNVGQNDVRRDDIRAARAAVAQAEAVLRSSRQTLADASIRTPISGIVSDRATEPGQVAAPGQTVMTIVALDNVFYEADVPEIDVARIRVGQPVTVRVDAYPGRSFSGVVRRIYPNANAASRTLRVRVVLPNNGGLLRPGLFARGDVITEQRESVVVSKDALVLQDDQTFVYVVENGNKASRRKVKLGIETDLVAEVRSGIQEGEAVIVAGQQTLKDGAPVSVKQDERRTVKAK